MRLTFFYIMFLCIILVEFAGCSIGDVPAPLRIDSGMDPDKQDEYTRFRTTYYFRIVDSCRVEDNKSDSSMYEKRVDTFRVRMLGKTRILNDAVYRFRMTGKASALFNKVSFGSGVLRAEQIDPFGSKVEYDEGTFKIKSGYNLRQKEMREALFDEISELRQLFKELKRDGSPGTEQLEQVIKNRIQLLNGGGSVLGTPTDPTPTVPIPSALCPDGRPIKHSYFLYGPEGVRELDPDERLLMAMSSDSKPLISLLQELSGRQRKALTTSSTGAEVLIKEQSWIVESQDKLKAFDQDLVKDSGMQATPKEIVNQLVHSTSKLTSFPSLSTGGSK